MKRALKVITLIIVVVLISSCSLYNLFPKKVELAIYNQSHAPIEVSCAYIDGYRTITIPKLSWVSTELKVYDKPTVIKLFIDGRYCDSVEELIIDSSYESFIIEPNISWIAVHNMTGSILELVGLTKYRSMSYMPEYSFWDSSGNLIGNSDIAPYQAKYIRMDKDDIDYIKEGYIKCWIGTKDYITKKTIKTPKPGFELDVYLHSSGLEEV